MEDYFGGLFLIIFKKQYRYLNIENCILEEQLGKIKIINLNPAWYSQVDKLDYLALPSLQKYQLCPGGCSLFMVLHLSPNLFECIWTKCSSFSKL